MQYDFHTNRGTATENNATKRNLHFHRRASVNGQKLALVIVTPRNWNASHIWILQLPPTHYSKTNYYNYWWRLWYNSWKRFCARKERESSNVASRWQRTNVDRRNFIWTTVGFDGKHTNIFVFILSERIGFSTRSCEQEWQKFVFSGDFHRWKNDGLVGDGKMSTVLLCACRNSPAIVQHANFTSEKKTQLTPGFCVLRDPSICLPSLDYWENGRTLEFQLFLCSKSQNTLKSSRNVLTLHKF